MMRCHGTAHAHFFRRRATLCQETRDSSDSYHSEDDDDDVCLFALLEGVILPW